LGRIYKKGLELGLGLGLGLGLECGESRLFGTLCPHKTLLY